MGLPRKVLPLPTALSEDEQSSGTFPVTVHISELMAKMRKELHSPRQGDEIAQQIQRKLNEASTGGFHHWLFTPFLPPLQAAGDDTAAGSQEGKTRGAADMADDQWIRVIIEKMDQDRRDTERLVESRLERIERLIEKQTDQFREAQDTIREQTDRVNQRIDQAFVEFRSGSRTVGYSAAGMLVAMIGLVIAVLMALYQANNASPPIVIQVPPSIGQQPPTTP